MMKTLLAASVLAALVSRHPSARMPNRTSPAPGRWTPAGATSDSCPPESIVIAIDHKDPALKATVTQKTAEGEMTSTRDLTTDGKENDEHHPDDGRRSADHVDVEVGGQGVDHEPYR